MMQPLIQSAWSYRRILVFWWGLFVIIQQAERLFLLPETWALEKPTAGILAKTLWIGFRADLITASIGIVAAVLIGGIVGLLLCSLTRWRTVPFTADACQRRGLLGATALIGMVLLTVLTVDMGYYGYNQQHLDFVFFEYLDDLLSRQTGDQMDLSEGGTSASQATQQTGAELDESEKWSKRLVQFFLVEAALAVAFCLFFLHAMRPYLMRWESLYSGETTAVLVVLLIAGSLGLHPEGPYAIRIAPISSAAYYTLAQNPILYAGEALRSAMKSRQKGEAILARNTMQLDDAVRLTQRIIGPEAMYPYPKYPLVRRTEDGTSLRFGRRTNVLLIFIEGLDRRYLGLTRQGHRVTPFLDRLKTDSVYFEHFFANGVQTSRGLFSSLCSYYPRQGTAVMKTRYAHDYLCLPSLLRKGGYRTEMVIGQHRDLNRLHLFLSRNGLQQLYDENEFPSGAERLGLGLTDGALFDFLRARIEVLQRAKRPFFLTTLTLSMHHPFTVPTTHPEVKALQAEPDGYVAALRYTDLMFEQFFTDLQQRGLLRNTVMLILGDHGRHEPVGRTDGEKQIGHFFSPLFIWVDGSLRSAANYRPHVVEGIIASQVDLAPTILALNGLSPRVAPFVGHDLSCALTVDCPTNNTVFLSSIYDDLIGLADRHGILVYSLRTETLSETDLQLKSPPVIRAANEPKVADRYKRLLALYVSANLLLEQGRVWSWKELGSAL